MGGIFHKLQCSLPIAKIYGAIPKCPLFTGLHFKKQRKNWNTITSLTYGIYYVTHVSVNDTDTMYVICLSCRLTGNLQLTKINTSPLVLFTFSNKPNCLKLQMISHISTSFHQSILSSKSKVFFSKRSLI